MRWPALGVASLLAAVLFGACGDDDDPSPTPGQTATPSAAATQPASATPAPSPTAAVTATSAPAKGLTGIFEEPRPVQANRVTPPPVPPSPFMAWDREATPAVIYDVVLGTEVNLGPGSAPVFSPDGKLGAWGAGTTDAAALSGEIRVIELATGSVRVLGPGRFPRFIENEVVAYFLPGGSNQLVAHNVATGAKTDITGQEVDRRNSERIFAERETTPDGFRVTSVSLGPGLSDVKVTNTANGQVVLAFQASAARPAGAGHIVVASKPSGATVNLFLVSIATGQGEYVATTRFTDGNFPLVADGARIAWVDDFCGQPAGNLFVYERATNALTEVAGISAFVRLTPDGRLALGAFGARRLMHPTTFETVATIPDGSDVNWTPDYRYASHGWTGGHGGLC